MATFCGILIKAKKLENQPKIETKVDLPTIGSRTIEEGNIATWPLLSLRRCGLIGVNHGRYSEDQGKFTYLSRVS